MPADMIPRDPGNTVPLINAIRATNVACVKALLDHGADPNIETSGYSCLGYAVYSAERNEEIVSLLLEAGADPNAAYPKPMARNTAPVTNLSLAMSPWSDNIPQVCTLLVQAGTRVHTSDLLLAISASHSSEDVLTALLKGEVVDINGCGCSDEQTGRCTTSVLMEAVSNVLGGLIKSHTRNPWGPTPEHYLWLEDMWVISKPRMANIERLLSAGANPNSAGNHDICQHWTPFQTAIMQTKDMWLPLRMRKNKKIGAVRVYLHVCEMMIKAGASVGEGLGQQTPWGMALNLDERICTWWGESVGGCGELMDLFVTHGAKLPIEPFRTQHDRHYTSQPYLYSLPEQSTPYERLHAQFLATLAVGVPGYSPKIPPPWFRAMVRQTPSSGVYCLLLALALISSGGHEMRTPIYNHGYGLIKIRGAGMLAVIRCLVAWGVDIHAEDYMTYRIHEENYYYRRKISAAELVEIMDISQYPVLSPFRHFIALDRDYLLALIRDKNPSPATLRSPPAPDS